MADALIDSMQVTSTSEEIECPLFMDKLPDDMSANPSLNAIQQVLYDEDSTPEERADNFKSQGNEALKKGKKGCKDAILFYTKAIDQKCENLHKNSIFYANRSQAQSVLGNWGKALEDAKTATELDQFNVKAWWRAANALMKLDKLDDVIKICANALEANRDNSSFDEKDLLEIRRKAEEKRDLLEHRRQKTVEEEDFQRRVNEERDAVILAECQKRNLRLLGPLFKEVTDGAKPYVDLTNGCLHWPVLFLYGESGQSDFIQDMPETDRLANHLKEMFPEAGCVPWDVENKYVHSKLQLFVTTAVPGERGAAWVEVDTVLSLARALAVAAKAGAPVFGVPTFHCAVRGSEFAKQMLSSRPQ